MNGPDLSQTTTTLVNIGTGLKNIIEFDHCSLALLRIFSDTLNGLISTARRHMQPHICTVLKVKEDMSTAGGEGEEKRKTQTRQRQNELPSELLDIIVPALKVGGITGRSYLCSQFQYT